MTRRVPRSPVYVLLAVLVCLTFPPQASSEEETLPADYPASLERVLSVQLSRLSTEGPTLDRLLQLSELYMNIADDLFNDEERKQLAYEAASAMAKRALTIDERSAHAHFLYAASLGSGERLKGLSKGGLVLGELKQHVRRAIELNPTHAQALQMMGGLCAELPWLLGGSDTDAELYLKRAIAADGRFTNAHLILARLLMRQGRLAEAREHIESVLRAEHPHYPYAWKHTFRPEAERLLNLLSK